MPAKGRFQMNIYLYVLDTVSDWEIGYLTAELYSRRFLDRSVNFAFTKISASGKSVTSMGGIGIVPDCALADVRFAAGDVLILPGADTWMSEEHKTVLDMVPGLLESGTTVAAICGATIALAGRGFLNGRKHTSNDKGFLVSMFPGYSAENYMDLPAVTDGNLITATGLAPLEFSYEVFRKAGVMKAETAEAWFGLHKTRTPECFFALMNSVAKS